MPIRHIFPYLEKICNLPNPTFYVTLNPFRGEESRWKDIATFLSWILHCVQDDVSRLLHPFTPNPRERG